MASELPCPSCGTLNAARAKFCNECGTKLAPLVDIPAADGRATMEAMLEAEEAAVRSHPGERRVVSVLFADLSGFTSFSERSDPEEVRALADEAAGRLGEIVVRYGGTVDKIIGDCVMAMFGAPTSHEDDPERAVRAALDMQDYVNEHSEKFAGLPLRIGVNTGETMYAPVGPGGQYTVIGDTVNVAARLQSAAAKGEILVGEPTYQAAAEAIELEAVAPITAKGKEEPVPAFRAVRVKGGQVKRKAARTPLIGRGVEFDRLWELWEKARTERRPYLAVILGEPGMGKSRLLAEVTARLSGAAAVHWGRCLPYGEGITYWPVVELVKEAAGILVSDGPQEMSAKLGSLLESLGTDDVDELRTMASALANLVGVPTTPRGTYTATDISQGELHWGIRRVFQLLAAHRRPLVLVFEDLHDAEPTLLDLVAFMLQGTDAPLYLLATSRPELREREHPILSGSWNRRVIELTALKEEDAAQLVEGLVAKLRLPDTQVSSLLRAAGGNPLFLEETVRMLGDLVLSGEGASLPVYEGVPMASSLHALIGSRLDRLPATEKDLAQQASVVGAVFWPGAMLHMDGVDPLDLEVGLDALEARDLVHENPMSSVAGEREFSFKHILIRDVAYGRLPKGERAGLHARCGEWIAALPGGEDEYVEIVAFHLEQACKLAAEVARSAIEPPILGAVQALARAAAKAKSREGTREAERFLSRALDLAAARLPETATELRLRRSETLNDLGDLDTASQELAGVADAAGAFGRTDLRCEALLWLANIDHKRARLTQAKERLAEARELAERIDDPRLVIRRMYQFASLVGDLEGSVHESIEDLRRGLHRAERIGDLPLRLEGHLRLGTLLLNMGRLEESEEHFTRCAELARQEGTLREEARASHFTAYIKFYRGEADEAERLELQVTRWLERTADSILQLQALRLLARIAMSKDDLAAAEGWLVKALPLAVTAGGWLVVEIERYLAEVCTLVGRLDEARVAVAGARAALPPESEYAKAALLMAEAFVAAADGDEPAARAGFEQALRLLEEPGLEMDLAEARLSYARALRRFGDEERARSEVDRARDAFRPMGAAGLVEACDRVLQEPIA